MPRGVGPPVCGHVSEEQERGKWPVLGHVSCGLLPPHAALPASGPETGMWQTWQEPL